MGRPTSSCRCNFPIAWLWLTARPRALPAQISFRRCCHSTARSTHALSFASGSLPTTPVGFETGSTTRRLDCDGRGGPPVAEIGPCPVDRELGLSRGLRRRAAEPHAHLVSAFSLSLYRPRCRAEPVAWQGLFGLGAPVRRHGHESPPGHDQHAHGHKSLFQSRSLDIPNRRSADLERGRLVHRLFYRSDLIELRARRGARIFAAVCVCGLPLARGPAVSSPQLRVRAARLARDKSLLRPHVGAEQPLARRLHRDWRRAPCQDELRTPPCRQLPAGELHLAVDHAEHARRALLQRRNAARIATARWSDFLIFDFLSADPVALGCRHLRAGMLRSAPLS